MVFLFLIRLYSKKYSTGLSQLRPNEFTFIPEGDLFAVGVLNDKCCV